MIFVRLVQLLLIAVPGALFGWLMHQELVPTGTFVAEAVAGESSPFIHRLLPDDRVGEVRVDRDGDTVQAITGDPAFFYVHPHRGFDRVEAEIRFKNERNPIVELGGLAQAGEEVYDLKPLHNRLIDTSGWRRLTDGNLVLLEREPRYGSVREFLADLPPRHLIATYHYSLEDPYLLPGYAPSPGIRTIDASVRGPHAIKTYVKDETLAFEFAFMDMNRAEGPDPVEAFVFSWDDRLVAEARVADDGDRSDQARPSGLRTLALEVPDLPEGVYKVELRAGRDIFFRSVRTRQHKVVFLDNLYLADEVGYWPEPRPVSFWTEAKALAFTTQHAEGLQEVSVGADSVRIEEPYRRHEHSVREDGVVRVTVPKGDAIVHTDGHVAFAPEQFFNPDPIALRHDTDLDALGVDYVIARYAPPRTEGDWLVATASFDASVLAPISEDGPGWKFAFSTPGISGRDGRLDIGSITFRFFRDPLSPDDVLGWLGIR